MHGQRAGLLDRAVGAAGHAVAAPRVGKPEVLERDIQEGALVQTLWGSGEAEPQLELGRQVSQESFGEGHAARHGLTERWFRLAHVMLILRPCFI